MLHSNLSLFSFVELEPCSFAFRFLGNKIPQAHNKCGELSGATFSFLKKLKMKAIFANFTFSLLLNIGKVARLSSSQNFATPIVYVDRWTRNRCFARFSFFGVFVRKRTNGVKLPTYNAFRLIELLFDFRFCALCIRKAGSNYFCEFLFAVFYVTILLIVIIL